MINLPSVGLGNPYYIDVLDFGYRYIVIWRKTH